MSLLERVRMESRASSNASPVSFVQIAMGLASRASTSSASTEIHIQRCRCFGECSDSALAIAHYLFPSTVAVVSGAQHRGQFAVGSSQCDCVVSVADFSSERHVRCPTLQSRKWCQLDHDS